MLPKAEILEQTTTRLTGIFRDHELFISRT